MMRGFKALAMRACHAMTHRISAFRNGSDGAVALMVALLMPVVVGGISLGAEVGYWYMLERKLQHVADAAAYSGAVRKKAGATPSDVDATVQQIAVSSGLPIGSIVAVTTDPSDDSKTLTVSATYDVPLYFSSFFRSNGTSIQVVATAEIAAQPPLGCVTVLSPDAPGALTVWGSATVNLEGCDVIAHSNASDAVDLGNTLTIEDGCVYTSGGVAGDQNLDTSVSERCVRPLTTGPTDPHADIEKPSTSDCGTIWNGLQVQCHGNHKLSNANTNDNTVYIITGSLTAKNEVITAQNISFILDGSTDISFNGNSTLQLSAPKTGPLKNMLFTGVQDDGVSNKINGNNGSEFDGTIHLPTSHIEFTGNSSATCTSLIGQTITFTGSAEMNCSNDRADDDEGTGGAITLLPL